jgi:hypothetical protein
MSHPRPALFVIFDESIADARSCKGRSNGTGYTHPLLSLSERQAMQTKLPALAKCNHAARVKVGLATCAGGALLCFAHVAQAQSLGWEGETGVFITPLAYTVATQERKVALPVLSYHYLYGGSVLGSFSQLSVTSGLANRVEFGYTRTVHDSGSDAALSPLWTKGFNIFHAKGAMVKENAFKQAWMPQISTGLILRTQVRNVGGVTQNRDTTNADLYVVATKTITQVKPMAILLSGGVKGTNAELIGLGGNADHWQPAGFGAVAFVFAGPAKSSIILGAEIAQQPRHPDSLPTAVIRTAFVYALRVVPSPRVRLNVDFGILEGPGVIAPGVDLKAKDCPGGAISYAF